MHDYHKWSCKTKELLRRVYKEEQVKIENADEDGKAPEFGYSQVVFEGSTNPLNLHRRKHQLHKRKPLMPKS